MARKMWVVLIGTDEYDNIELVGIDRIENVRGLSITTDFHVTSIVSPSGTPEALRALIVQAKIRDRDEV